MRDFPGVDNDAQTLDMTLFFNLRWVEPRLIVKSSPNDNSTSGIPLETEVQSMLWMPGTY